MGITGKVKCYLKRISLRKEKVAVPILYGRLLEGRAALVTGGTSGIGLAIAESFVRNGAAVAITGRSHDRLNAALDSIASEVDGAKAAGIVLDNATSDASGFEHAIDEAEKCLGMPVDILVNNAGIMEGDSIPRTSMAEFYRTLQTNLRGPYFLSQEFAKKLVMGGRTGNVLNVCSSSSLRPAISPYALSKWGMRGLTAGLAKELVPHGIVVNGIAPGPTLTRMLVKDGDENLANSGVPAGRYVTAEEVANMATVLVSDISRMVVGDIVYITGGCGNLTFDDMGYSMKG